MPTKSWAVIYELDDPSFQNIMGGPHYNVVDLDECDDVVATVWIYDDANKCQRDALLMAAAPNLLRACVEAVKWGEAQDDTVAPRWIRRMAKAVQLALNGDKHSRTFYD